MRPLCTGLALLLGSCAAPKQAATPEPAAAASHASHKALSFWERRATHVTAAKGQGPSPRSGAPVQDPVDTQRVVYRQQPELWAWLGRPSGGGGDAPQRAPALIYFHGDFSIHPFDHKVTQLFRDAGFVTVAPILRGENASAGDFTLLHDELDDAIALVKWVAARDDVDPERIYVFGHSVGGGLSALLSLVPALPVKATGSSGGLYVPQTFVRWAGLPAQRELIRFDVDDREELELRCLGPHVASMQRPHIAYVGEEDRWFHPNATAVSEAAAEHGAPFVSQRVPGDHGGALKPSLRAFLQRVQATP